MKIKQIIVVAAVFTVCSGCGKSNGEEKPSPPGPSSEITLKGSFESCYKRYVKADKHAGQSNAKKIETEWCDTVWQNDRVHKQLVLWTEKGNASDVTYTVSDLQYDGQRIASSQVRLRFATYVSGDAKALGCGEQTTRQPVYIADALSQTPVRTITPDDPAKVWVTVDIPKNTSPGLYEGTITVAQSGKAGPTFTVKLLVTNHALPDVKNWNYHLDIWQFPYQMTELCAKSGVRITPFSTEYKSLMAPFYEMLADAGQTAVTTYIKDGAFQLGKTMIRWQLDKDQTWSFDYTDFDAFVEFMFALGIDKQINCFSLGGWYNTIGYYDAASSSSKTKELAIGSDEYNAVWDAFLTSFHTHLTAKGWLNKTVLYLDEIRNDDVRKIVTLIRKNSGDWKIGAAGSYIDADMEREFYDYSTIFGYDRASTNNTYSSFYTSCTQTHPNNYVTGETSPAEMVWMAWYSAAKGMNGYTRWAYDYWQSADPTNIQDGTNSAGDFNMIYRTGNKAGSTPVASIRFELLREGIQDYEKIHILASPALRSVVQGITASTAATARQTVQSARTVLKQVSAN